jgi:1,4-dihydroxy-2-naphthoate octaprenyltransferase
MKMAQHNDNSHIQQLDRQTAKLLILFVVFYSAANFIAPFI